MSGLEDDLRKAEQPGHSKKALIVLAVIGALFGIFGGIAYWTLSELPAVNALEEYAPAESSKVLASDGRVLAEFYVERRTFVPHYTIPDHVKKAFVSIEDTRFYSHPGIDIIGIIRALYYDIRAGGIVQGGSTITQQLAKMLFLKPEKSIMRKVREAILAIRIERRYTKDEILGLYLNQTYFGTRAFGIQAASETYFGKSAKDLTVAEAALLASLPKAPSQYSPFRNPEKSRSRRTVVLREMLGQGFITQQQFDEAVNAPLPASPHFRKYEAPYFVEMLRQQLEQKYGAAAYTAGYRIHSTIDLDMQHAAEAALAEGVRSLAKRGRKNVQASLVAMDARTGQVRAMVGGFDFWQNQFNRATQALRQPGSAFKPFVYIAALRGGMTSQDIIDDSPLSFKGAKPGETWSPRNYDGAYNGPVTLKTALAKSLNAATVRLAAKIGLEEVIETARDLGIKSDLQPYMPLALGASDVTLIEMVTAYAVFATGKLPEPVFYTRITDRNGIIVEEVYPKLKPVLDEAVVSEMQVLLRAVVQEGTAVRARAIGRPVFGKTGTTNDYTDAWFIGFDDHLVAGVWTGRDDHKPIGSKETGASAALPIWIEFMKKTGPPEEQ